MCPISHRRQPPIFTLSWPRQFLSKLEETLQRPSSRSPQPAAVTRGRTGTCTCVPLRSDCTLLDCTTLSLPTGCPGRIHPMCPGSLVRGSCVCVCVFSLISSKYLSLFGLSSVPPPGQAMEIGSAALNILVECWDGHLTPPEVASLADRASRARDPNMVRAAAELALSCLPHAHALNPNEIQRALVQCKEQVLLVWVPPSDRTDWLCLHTSATSEYYMVSYCTGSMLQTELVINEELYLIIFTSAVFNNNNNNKTLKLVHQERTVHLQTRRSSPAVASFCF